jgi:hypothetical protein
VTQYLAELYLSTIGAIDFPEIVARARGAADSLACEGVPVRCVRSTFVPENETWFLHYEGTSVSAVGAALARAGLRCTRVIEAVEQRFPGVIPPGALTATETYTGESRRR